MDEIRLLVRDANQSLLHDTIGIPDDQWHGPSLLPGWTRAHVATHLARNADALRRRTEAAVSGTELVEPTPDERFEALERGADRPALSLQIDLDTSATALAEVWRDHTDWHRPIPFLGRTRPLSVLPLARLHELCVHHLDLDTGFTPDQVQPEAAGWLLAWVYERLGDARLPAAELQAESGQTGTIGKGEPETVIRASDAALWGWLTGRATLVDADGIAHEKLPLLA